MKHTEISLGEPSTCTLSKLELPKREQISEEGEKKFRYDDKKLSVVIYDYDEMEILSDYIGMNVKVFLENYLMTNANIPIIIKCEHRLSLSGTPKYGMLSNLSQFMGGPTWEQEESRALTLKAFLNPGEYPEYMV